MRPRILFVTTILGRDGPSRAIEALAPRLSHHYEMAVCSLTTVDPAVHARLDAGGVRVHALDMRGRFDLSVLWHLARHCRQWRPAIVHTHLSRADWVGRLVGRATGVPRIVTTIHNLHSRMYAAEFGPVKAATGRALDRHTAPFVDWFVAVSHGVQRDLVASGVAAERVTVIPPGVDLGRRESVRCREAIRRAWGLAADDLVVGTAALLKAQKGLFDLVDAAGHLSRRGVRATVVIMGDGPDRGTVERAARAVGGAVQVRLAGWVDDAMAWLPGLDVFVLPSRWEGLPVALLEAMSLGIPVVGTRVSGIEDVVDDGCSGWLVDVGQPGQLADRLASALESATARACVGAAGRRTVERRFSAEVAASAHDALYQELLQRDVNSDRPIC